MCIKYKYSNCFTWFIALGDFDFLLREPRLLDGYNIRPWAIMRPARTGLARFSGDMAEFSHS